MYGSTIISNLQASLVHFVLFFLSSLLKRDQTSIFIALFLFRYVRLFVHLIGFWLLYKPSPIPVSPTVTRKDCTVIIPTIDPTNVDFDECIVSVLHNAPAAIIIVTVGERLRQQCLEVATKYAESYPGTKTIVLRAEKASKRAQVSLALPYVQTSIVALVDDHVFWLSERFLPTALAPFEDAQVGCVGTNKRVRRIEPGHFNLRAFWNMIGALYLERHNFELRATNAIDGGVFVVSGRTSLHRTRILADPRFLSCFQNELFFFNHFGPLDADDDNFITRWMVKGNWKVKIQYCQDALIETTVGTYPKFIGQCLRWVRTTWRSNTTSLVRDRVVWRRQPWCIYAVYLTSYVNFALFYDLALLLTFRQSRFHYSNSGPGTGLGIPIRVLVTFILAAKLVKLTPYFIRHAGDLFMLPGYFLFAYAHSLIKLYAALTFYSTAWGGRDLNAVDAAAVAVADSDTNDDDTDSDTAISNSTSISATAAVVPVTVSVLPAVANQDERQVSLKREGSRGESAALSLGPRSPLSLTFGSKAPSGSNDSQSGSRSSDPTVDKGLRIRRGRVSSKHELKHDGKA